MLQKRRCLSEYNGSVQIWTVYIYFIWQRLLYVAIPWSYNISATFISSFLLAYNETLTNRAADKLQVSGEVHTCLNVQVVLYL